MMKKGFTLLEMIIVMGVIVVLFLLTMPNITKTTEVIDEKGCKAQLKVVDAAILQYRLKFEAVPTDIGQIVSAGFLSENQTKCNNNQAIRIVSGQAHE